MNLDKQTVIFSQAQVSNKRRMPALEIVHEAFARSLRIQLTHIVGSSVVVNSSFASLKNYQEFIDSVPVSANIQVVGFDHIEGYGCWSLDMNTLNVAIDTIFGGNGSFPPSSDSKKLSITEMRIARRILEVIVQEYEKAWKPLADIRFGFARHEERFESLRLAAPEEQVLHSKFKVNVNGNEGYLDFCVPYWVLAPFKDKIWSNEVKVKRETDLYWANSLETQLQEASVSMVAVLARKQMTIREILGMSIGEIIPIDIDDPVTMYVDGLPMIQGKYGVKNNKYSVKVETIQHPAEFLKNPVNASSSESSVMRSEERGDRYMQQKGE
jgi:flagellar motor switch protein FliM